MSRDAAETLTHSPVFAALKRLAGDSLGIQLVLVDADGALAHRRGGVLEARSAPCRAALFTRDGFTHCDSFYETLGRDGTRGDGRGRASPAHLCPFGLSARLEDLGSGLHLVASGFCEADDGPNGALLAEVVRDPVELAAALRDAPRLRASELRLVELLLAACRRELERLRGIRGGDRGAQGDEPASPRTRRLTEAVRRYARSEALVLISGETGSGKNRVARAIHAASARADGPFVVFRPGAVQPGLFEATLFGHTRGAFTDAARASEGLLGEARGGTLVLDEVSELSPHAQASLLRLLADGRYRPVGSRSERRLEARLLATTGADLSAAVADGRLREDLFYRLDVLRLRVPPLRERTEELPALMGALATERGLDLPELESEAWRCLRRHRWPGNLHELAAEVTRLAHLSLPTVTARSLSPKIASAGGYGVDPADGRFSPEPRRLADAVADLEREMIRDGLTRHGGNRSHLAKELGVSRTTLIARIRRYGLG